MQRFVLVGLVMVVLGAAAPARASVSPPDGAWVTAWGSAPHGAGGGGATGLEPWSLGFARHSVRMIVTPLGAGSQLRLSNRFGGRPVTVSGVSVAERRQGAELVAGTVRALRFAGQPSITIPRGGVAISDAVAFDVRPGVDLAVTMWFTRSSGPPTVHSIAGQTSYVSRAGSGDLTADVSGRAFLHRTESRFFLSAIDVLAPPTASAGVTIGDSLTDGASPRILRSENNRWPDFLHRRLVAAGSEVAVVNAGIGGNRVTRGPIDLVGLLGPSMLSRLESDVFSMSGVRAVILLGGTNDVGMRGRPGQVIAGLREMARRVHAHGLKIAVATLPPMGGSIYDPFPYGPLDVDRPRRQVNAWIRSQDVFDAVIDFDAALRDPERPRRIRREYDRGDRLHPSLARYAAMADAVDLDMVRRLVDEDGVPAQRAQHRR